jgi:hypothetical protein
MIRYRSHPNARFDVQLSDQIVLLMIGKGHVRHLVPSSRMIYAYPSAWAIIESRTTHLKALLDPLRQHVLLCCSEKRRWMTMMNDEIWSCQSDK